MWEFFIALFWLLFLIINGLIGEVRWITYYNKECEKKEAAKPFLEKYEVPIREYGRNIDQKILDEARQELEGFLGKKLIITKYDKDYLYIFYYAKLGKIPPLYTFDQPGRHHIIGRSNNIKLLKWYDKMLRENGMTYPLVYTFSRIKDGTLMVEYDGKQGYISELPDDFDARECGLVAYWEPVEYYILSGGTPW